MNDSKKHLQLPQGTEGFYLDEAFLHKKTVRSIEDTFSLWGYMPAMTPVFDFYDVYSPLLDEKTTRSLYRLIDRDGELLMLKNDNTLFLAKQMGLALKTDDLPARVYYTDTILRHEEEYNISTDEYYQAGAELIGSRGIEADLEMCLLLQGILHKLDLPMTRIHIGSRKLIQSLPKIEAAGREKLLAAVRSRNATNIQSGLKSAGYTAAQAGVCTKLLLFIGNNHELADLVRRHDIKNIIGDQANNEIEYLSKMYIQLDSLDEEHLFRIDLSETGAQPYYTGIAFRAYTDGVSTEIASGGRYDGLLGHFGLDAPSIGFSLMTRKIEKLLDLPESHRKPEEASGSTFIDRYMDAKRKRESGKPIVLKV